jgi:predicted DNA-binding protein (UPF0251 family)
MQSLESVDSVVAANTVIVDKVARSASKPGVAGREYADLWQEGWVALREVAARVPQGPGFEMAAVVAVRSRVYGLAFGHPAGSVMRSAGRAIWKKFRAAEKSLTEASGRPPSPAVVVESMGLSRAAGIRLLRLAALVRAGAEIPDDGEPAAPDAPYFDAVDSARGVFRTLARADLTPREWNMMADYCLDGITFADFAHREEISMHRMAKTLHSARKKLRRVLETETV